MAVNKVIIGNEVRLDLTSDTVSADKLLKGTTAHDKSGEKITGTCNFDIDSSEATAAVAEVLSGRSFAARGEMLTGTMPDNGSVSGTISEKAQEYPIPMGFHDGSGKVAISSTEQDKLIPSNIKQGVEILGVTGAYGGEAVKAHSKSVTPALTSQTVLPDSGYDYLSQVTISAIPITETENSAGGITLKVGE